jgi:hypothetical protein
MQLDNNSPTFMQAKSPVCHSLHKIWLLHPLKNQSLWQISEHCFPKIRFIIIPSHLLAYSTKGKGEGKAVYERQKDTQQE